MQIANSFFAKTNRVISAGVRSTSCDRGWLQLFTHIVCGTFTVASFFMILVVTLLSSKKTPGSDIQSRCRLDGCRVICKEAPFYEEYEDDIVLRVMEAEDNCEDVFLTLHEPSFTNGSLPQNWLPTLRPVVVELRIVGGNLRRISHNVFSSAFAGNVRLLFLEKVTLESCTQYALIGLRNLENIYIRQCEIIDMQENILSAVSQTLEAVTVIQSGCWNPASLTGLSQLLSLPMLTTVNLSNNNFSDILGNTSFTRLRFCKSLDLSSNKISYIGPGAFDNLVNLEYLNLNNNLLQRISPGLSYIVPLLATTRVRLNLAHNLWHCDCFDRDLRGLIRRGVLLVDPTCHSPEMLRGKTFQEFNKYCRAKEPKQIIVVDMKRKAFNVEEGNETLMKSHTCVTKPNPNFTSTLISPFRDYSCSVDVLNHSLFNKPSMVVDFYDTEHYFWIRPIILVTGENFTMVELSLSEVDGYGLIWFRNSCPSEVFCVNIVPDTIRLYDLDLTNEYTFCPVTLRTGAVDSDRCIAYVSIAHNSYSRIRLILYPLISVGCLFFGALSLYMLIRKYPYLLKGSKRLLFVKHKTVEALVLPPKVPLRGVLSDRSLDNPTDLFNISEPLRHDFTRSGSVRSNHSYTPSYISALQPTEEQLADWRYKHENKRIDHHYVTISTISSDTPISLSCVSDHLYYSLDCSTTTSKNDPNYKNLEIKL